MAVIVWAIVLHQPVATQQVSETTAAPTFIERDKLAKHGQRDQVLTKNWADGITQQLDSLLADSRWRDAVARVSDIYSQATPKELEQFKARILQYVEHLVENKGARSASILLTDYAQTFDDADAWRRLGTLAVELGDWNTAVAALLASSKQEFEPVAYETSLRELVRVSSLLRASLEKQGDYLGVLELYQRIYDQHPHYPRFQLELANSHLRLQDDASARPLLESLSYDPELGSLAQQVLIDLDERLKSAIDSAAAREFGENSQNQRKPIEITVPLIRSGNSLLVDVAINSDPIRLLLDTGASITTLSKDAIQRLGLKPSGNSVTLSTANGVRKSDLYRARNLQLGKFRLHDLLVAEIEIGSDERIDGLLGTDVLSQIDDRFSYLIDDRKNALIFRKN